VKALEEALKDRDLAVSEAAEEILGRRKDLGRVSELIQRARDCLAAKKYAEALYYYDVFRVHAPDNALAKEGIARCRDALRAAKSNAMVSKLLSAGNSAMKAGDYRKAMSLYRTTLELVPKNQAAKKGLDECQRRLRVRVGEEELD
jgi:tetratricopeptide (TPR) repeat protein